MTKQLDSVTRNWIVVTGGSFARLGLGFVTSVVIARSLGPEAFGVFAVLATTATIAGAVGDLGLTNAAVRRITSALSRDAGRAAQIWAVYFWARLLAVGIVALLGIALAGPISRLIFSRPDDSNLLRYAFAGIIATGVSGTATAVLQATGRFGRLSGVMLANAGLTLIMAIALAYTQQLTLYTAILVLGIATSLVSFALGYRLLPGNWPLGVPGRAAFRQHGSDLMRFGYWLWVGGILSILATQLDVLLVNEWSVPATVGVYSLAVSLASRVEVINHSLYTVLLVSASTLDTPAEIRRYVRSGLLRSAVISLALLPMIPLAGPFIATFYGSEYERAADLFQSLLGVTVLNLLLTPILLLGFTFDRPGLIAATDAARVLTLVGAGLLLIPIFGVTGAIVAKLLASVAGGCVLLVLLARRPLGQRPVQAD